MKKLLGIALAFALGASPAIALANSTLVDQGALDGRSYHENMYKRDNCKMCHGVDAPTDYPADESCLKCHNVDKLAQKTARDGEEEWQNPHNNLHWGKEVPCVECHAEHQEKQPMCADCHTFEYPNHKK
ncbi:cytochrome c3 family protein [Paraferrimonas haliotis]|uniref:Cytochrome c n=1 Tax=Paraferrimonas haliotis TaxID=2013866 RepID=A0AA37TQS8_9GAMM|nr:cytochrome c3 family protein [Paraferrimonas haliotis]GLS82981.1 cytochrome c [Paraferrimonas haliotis]